MIKADLEENESLGGLGLEQVKQGKDVCGRVGSAPDLTSLSHLRRSAPMGRLSQQQLQLLLANAVKQQILDGDGGMTSKGLASRGI